MSENRNNFRNKSFNNNMPFDKASYYRKHLEKKSKKDQILEGSLKR